MAQWLGLKGRAVLKDGKARSGSIKGQQENATSYFKGLGKEIGSTGLSSGHSLVSVAEVSRYWGRCLHGLRVPKGRAKKVVFGEDNGGQQIQQQHVGSEKDEAGGRTPFSPSQNSTVLSVLTI